ncbi:MAG: response regulator [Candidatus Omnitrophota bacterium]|nr:MAG: response regulator [Candidatus Omnitrophota bacterium]
MPKVKKILFVEDDLRYARIISMRLEINGYKVVCAQDGEEAFRKLRTEEPDLLLLDLMLPKIDGFEVCRLLKFEEKYKGLPIIILTALNHKKDRQKAVASGADAYFIKPFNLEALLVKIRSFIG